MNQITSDEKAMFREIGWVILTRAISEVSANTNGWKECYRVTALLEGMRFDIQLL